MAEPRGFTRDHSLSSEVADDFGGGAGNAEQLIEANALTRTEHLEAAQMIPADTGQPEAERRRPDLFDEDGKLTISRADVRKAADLDDDQLVAFDVHGDYLVFSFATADGRVHKDVLSIDVDGDSLESPYGGTESPARAAIRAQVEARSALTDAQKEADKILEKARAEADKIRAKAAEEAEEERAETVQEAVTADVERQQAEAKEEAKPASSAKKRAPAKKSGAKKRSAKRSSKKSS